MGIGNYGIYLAITLFITGVLAFIFQTFIGQNSNGISGGGNLILIIISLEIILLSIGLFLINVSVGLDDLIGANITLYILPLAGAESAVALALLVAYYPQRGSIGV